MEEEILEYNNERFDSVKTLADIPVDVLCYKIFGDFSVYWITNNIIYVCKQIVGRGDSFKKCCSEDYKIPSSTLAYKMFSYDVIKKNDPEFFGIACSHGYTDLVREILGNAHARPNYNCFEKAVSNNHIEIVEYFLKDSRFVHDRKWNDTLECAIVNDCEDIALLLLKDGRFNPHYKGEIEFVLACQSGMTRLVKHLLTDPFTNPSISENKPIKEACENGHTDIVFELLRVRERQIERILLEEEKKLKMIGTEISQQADEKQEKSFVQVKYPLVDPSVDDNICVRLSCSSGHVGVVELLIFSDNVDPTTNNQECIRTASSNGHHEVVEVLMRDPRIDPSAMDNHAVREAAANGHLEVIKMLTKHTRVNIHEFDDSSFRYAARNGHLDVVKYLIEEFGETEIDVNVRDGWAFNYACYFGREEVVKYLLAMKSLDPEANSNFAFRNACKFGHYNIVRMLLRDDRIKWLDDNDNEGLCNAIREGHIEIVKLLMNDERIDTSNGYCMEACCVKGDIKITKVLMEHHNFKLENPTRQICKYLILANSKYHYDVSRYLFKNKDLKTEMLSRNEDWLFHAEEMKKYDENEELSPMTPLDENSGPPSTWMKVEEKNRLFEEKEESGGEEDKTELERGLAFADNIFKIIHKSGI